MSQVAMDCHKKERRFLQFSSTSIHYWTTKPLSHVLSSQTPPPGVSRRSSSSGYGSFDPKVAHSSTTFSVDVNEPPRSDFHRREFVSSTTLPRHLNSKFQKPRRSLSAARSKDETNRSVLPGQIPHLYVQRYESLERISSWMAVQPVETFRLDSHDRIQQMIAETEMSRRARPPDPAQIFWPSTADYVNGNHHIYATPSTCQPSDDAIRINGSGGYASTPTFASVYAVPATSNGYQSDYSVDTAESESLIHYENNLERHKDERDRIQKKTFTKWVNKHLQKSGRNVDDLFVDLQNGRNLIALLEALTSETLPKEHGETRFHRTQNVQACLDFLNRRHIKLVNIRPKDIVEGNGKLTLGLIWTIILNFQVSVINQRRKEERKLITQQQQHTITATRVHGTEVQTVELDSRSSSRVGLKLLRAQLSAFHASAYKGEFDF